MHYFKKKIIFLGKICLLMIFASQSVSAASPRISQETKIYNAYVAAARSRSAQQMIQLKRLNYDVNILNDQGDTPLCGVIKEGDVKAYQFLKVYGINLRPDCLERIDDQKMGRFCASLPPKDPVCEGIITRGPSSSTSSAFYW